MPEMRVVDKPKTAPGRCLVSSDARGPMLDTGRDVRRYGRVYIALDALRRPLEANGWLNPENAQKLRDSEKAAREKAELLQDRADDYEDLLQRLADAVGDFLPQPEPEVVTKTREIPRNPTEGEIEDWLERHPDHPMLKRRRPLEPGSQEEHSRLYGSPYDRRRQDHSRNLARKRAENTKAQQAVDPTIEQDHGPSEEQKHVELHGQNVNVDELLSEKVSTIVSFCNGQPQEFREAVVNRELELADKASRKARKGVVEGLGFEFVEDDDDENSDEEGDGSSNEETTEEQNKEGEES